MRLAVLGGTGNIGRLVVEQALAAGHEATVLVRDRGRLPWSDVNNRLLVVDGDARDPNVVARAMDGADACMRGERA